MSQAEADRQRVEAIAPQGDAWDQVAPGRGKGDDIHIAPWYRYMTGRNASYPERSLEAQYSEVARRLDAMAHDDGDPEEWDVHHWQDINPVHTEALVQLSCGGPQIVYHGGLLHVRLRYWDLDERRPGLPAHVAALVSRIADDAVQVTMTNTSPQHTRSVRLLPGAFGEHRFTQVVSEDVAVQVDGLGLELCLAPASSTTLRIGMRRYAGNPSYDLVE